MSEKTMKIVEMLDMLPEKDQALAYELIKKLILACFTKLTPNERKRLEESEEEIIGIEEIDWN